MRILLAVIDDLYTFATGALFSLGKKKEADAYITKGYPEEAVEIEEIEPLPEEAAAEIPEFRSVGDIVADVASTAPFPQKNTVMYVGGPDTPLYMRPTKEFDTVIDRLPYGALVMVLGQQGRWTEIAHKNKRGWILREDLVDRAAHVYPHLVIGEENTAHDPNTMRIRAIIDDLFAAGLAEMDLQCGEYIQYRLTRKGQQVPWPEARSRTPGLWHRILKGAPGVHIGITPKTGAIMEYMIIEDRGHLAFVEAVFPDETINISEADMPDRGIYSERVLSQNEWKELKPVFIQLH